jgi:hypothetical protein
MEQENTGMRNKRLRQYRKIWYYCHKRIFDGHIITRHEHEILLCVENRAVVAVFNGLGNSKQTKLPIPQEVIENITLGGY